MGVVFDPRCGNLVKFVTIMSPKQRVDHPAVDEMHAVYDYNGRTAVMPYGWEGNRRSGVLLAMRHRLKRLIHLSALGLSKGDEHTTNTPVFNFPFHDAIRRHEAISKFCKNNTVFCLSHHNFLPQMEYRRRFLGYKEP